MWSSQVGGHQQLPFPTPGHMSKKLDWKLSSRDLSWQSDMRYFCLNQWLEWLNQNTYLCWWFFFSLLYFLFIIFFFSTCFRKFRRLDQSKSIQDTTLTHVPFWQYTLTVHLKTFSQKQLLWFFHNLHNVLNCLSTIWWAEIFQWYAFRVPNTKDAEHLKLQFCIDL